MKARWQLKTLGEVCDVLNGGTPKTGVPEYWGGPHQWVTPAEMGKRASPYIAHTERTITDEGVRDSSARLLPPQSVILSSRAPIGYLVINTETMATNQGCKGLVPKTGLDTKYLFYFLSSITQLLNDLGSGATFKELSGGKLKEIQIPVPPLPEQQRIVTLVDEAFAHIATAKANAEQNLQNARALFESHLQSVFMERGDNWVVAPLEEVGVTQTGTTPKPSDRSNYGNFMPFIKPGDFRSDGSLGYERDGLSEAGAGGNRKVPANSVLMVCIGATIGKCGYSDRVVTTNQQINAFTPNSGVHHKFIYYQMCTEDFQRRVIHASGQATLPIINKSKWSALNVSMPPTLEDQMRLATEFDLLQRETQRLEYLYQQKLSALDALKKSLLHQAFSGQL
jgi:type I restriction enzyme, S subunit